MLTDLWYQFYEILQKDAPECVDEYLENTAAHLELPVDYLIQEFLP
jgi:hypothetical protein